MFREFLISLCVVMSGEAAASSLPAIILSNNNVVPSCVDPDKLMRFVADRNKKHEPPRQIDQRFVHLAEVYQRFGTCVAREPEKCVGVRWDYAFFQMLIETNYLSFQRPDGKPASVRPAHNNFAGVGATVGGRPGEKFKDVETGVLAHLQHVLMYSNTYVPKPVANRTRQVQDDVQAIMRRLNRPVTFNDLARQWTGTNKSSYARDMASIAHAYDKRYCVNQKITER
jgi:hypothetical protein